MKTWVMGRLLSSHRKRRSLIGAESGPRSICTVKSIVLRAFASIHHRGRSIRRAPTPRIDSQWLPCPPRHSRPSFTIPAPPGAPGASLLTTTSNPPTHHPSRLTRNRAKPVVSRPVSWGRDPSVDFLNRSRSPSPTSKIQVLRSRARRAPRDRRRGGLLS